MDKKLFKQLNKFSKQLIYLIYDERKISTLNENSIILIWIKIKEV